MVIIIIRTNAGTRAIAGIITLLVTAIIALAVTRQEQQLVAIAITLAVTTIITLSIATAITLQVATVVASGRGVIAAVVAVVTARMIALVVVQVTIIAIISIAVTVVDAVIVIIVASGQSATRCLRQKGRLAALATAGAGTVRPTDIIFIESKGQMRRDVVRQGPRRVHRTARQEEGITRFENGAFALQVGGNFLPRVGGTLVEFLGETIKLFERGRIVLVFFFRLSTQEPFLGAIKLQDNDIGRIGMVAQRGRSRRRQVKVNRAAILQDRIGRHIVNELLRTIQGVAIQLFQVVNETGELFRLVGTTAV